MFDQGFEEWAEASSGKKRKKVTLGKGNTTFIGGAVGHFSENLRML